MRRALARAAGPVAAAGLAAPGLAETDFSALTPAERAIFHNEIRQVLLTMPELLPAATPRPAPQPAEIYADNIAADHARIDAHSDALFSHRLPGFGPAGAKFTIALFTRANCPSCARAEADLRDLAQTHDLRVTLLDMRRHRELAEALGLDIAPSYVLPDMMLRGALPPIVLKRYLPD